MTVRIFVSSMLLIFTSQPGAIAQVTGPQTSEGCIRVAAVTVKVSVALFDFYAAIFSTSLTTRRSGFRVRTH